jgi:hypothetical protein
VVRRARIGGVAVAAVAAVAVAALAACSKDDGASGDVKAMAAGGPGARDAVIEAWKKGGLQPSAMAPATVAFGKDCQSGTVSNVDVLVCAYGSPAEAKAAEAAGYEWVGGTTGSAVVSGAVLVAIADRRKADLNGKTINQLMKLVPREAKKDAEPKKEAEPKEAEPAAKDPKAAAGSK